MARLHVRKHGRAKSRKPALEPNTPIKDMKVTKEEAEKIAVDLAKQKIHIAQIGQKLKEEYNVLYIKHIFGKRLSKILEENGIKQEIPQDLIDLMKRAARMHVHLQNNKKDLHNKVKLAHVEAKIHRLVKYYKRTGKLPENWEYRPEEAILLIR